MRPLPNLEVFTRAEARPFGWSDSSLSRAARAGRVIVVRHGLFARTGAPADRVAAIAAARAVAGLAITHRSALLLHGLPLVGSRPCCPEITVEPGGTGSAHQALLHRATLGAEDLVLVDGNITTSVARTLIDVARRRPSVTSVPAIDAALHRGLVVPSELDDVVLRCWNWPGIARAHRALRLVDSRAESPLESISRVVIGWLRLPPPDLQPLVRDEYGRETARLDFYWDEFGVAGEADGRDKYVDRSVLGAEKERQETTEDLGIAFARWGWEHAWHKPRVLRHKIESAFARGVARNRSGLPRKWSISRTEPAR